ncbi:hypothetical protein G9G54_13525 [Paenibacillus sp. EKM212P]|uniref:hypothetical protein n=1 Tax=Paenibacillus sp. EKM212P TaxID=1683680 RepID=UPI0013EDA303|nr:hypothetical protein [Paenibacillus sp. EKM212P]KAF6578292.1 hypothetical protein G9G54_13525 [Paenibacillus sp. EKM212P]
MANVQLQTVNPNLGDISQSGVDQLRSLVKQLHNAAVMQTEELLYLLNNLDTQNINEVDGDILVKGTVTAIKMNVQKLSAITADMGKITAGEIYGAHIATSEDQYPMVTITPEGLIAYGPQGGESVSLGQATDGGALLFMDNGSPRGSIYGDAEGFHVGNMGGIYIKSVDDKTYLQGPIDFTGNLGITGLQIRDIEDLQRQLGEINGNILNNMITNASFDNSTRNLKLYSETRTVATVFIPGSSPE